MSTVNQITETSNNNNLTATVERSHIETKLLFDVYIQDLKAISDTYIEKFIQSEAFDDEVLKQLDSSHQNLLHFEKYLIEKLNFLKEGILKFSNDISTVEKINN